jgi:hypothetical protein
MCSGTRRSVRSWAEGPSGHQDRRFFRAALAAADGALEESLGAERGVLAAEAEKRVGAVGDGAVELVGRAGRVERAGGAGRPVSADAADAAGVGVGKGREQALVAVDVGEAARVAGEEESGWQPIPR